VLAAWFAGSEEGAKDVAIWCSRKRNGTWSQPEIIADKEGIAHWNPVLFCTDDGLHLIYKIGHTIPGWYSIVTKSTDQGVTWSTPVQLVKGDVGGRGPVRNKPIRLQDGTLLAPASVEGEYWDAFVDISEDQGHTWEASGMVPLDHGHFPGQGVIQPTLWESDSGQVHMLLRSTAGTIYRSDSNDKGKTWCPCYPTTLPNNNSGIDLVKLKNGTLVLVYNPVGVDRGERTPLVVRSSFDNGQTWEQELVLEDAPGEYSYPAIVEKDNRVYITYTWNREQIVYWEIEIVA
jgi:predicted neuraminidase